MPLYEYECQKCGYRFEITQKFSEDPLKVCSAYPVCDGELKKVIGKPLVELKGSCWAKDGYKK